MSSVGALRAYLRTIHYLKGGKDGLVSLMLEIFICEDHVTGMNTICGLRRDGWEIEWVQEKITLAGLLQTHLWVILLLQVLNRYGIQHAF